MDVEALERLVVRLWGTAEQCSDLPLRRNLRKLVYELIDLIEESEQSEEDIRLH